MTVENETTGQDTWETLARALSFRPDDLEANRAGTLSEWQLYDLRVRRRRSIAIGLTLLVILAFIATLFLYGGINGSAILTLIGIGVTLGNAALIGIFGRHWMRLSADIRGGKVRAYHGTLERVIKPMSRRVMQYMIRVDGAETFVPKEAFDVFLHEARYTLYRTPYTGILLSAEAG